MLLQSLRALCLAPEGPGSIWNHWRAPVRSTGLSGSVACGFRTDLHFADVGVVLTREYRGRCILYTTMLSGWFLGMRSDSKGPSCLLPNQ